jgi:hypothetical protein
MLVVRCHAKGKAGEAPLSDLFAGVAFANSNAIDGDNFNDPYVTLSSFFVGYKTHLIEA